MTDIKQTHSADLHRNQLHSDNIPDVHEAEATDVGTVGVGDQTNHLFAGELQCEQLVEQTERTRHNPSCPYTSHL